MLYRFYKFLEYTVEGISWPIRGVKSLILMIRLRFSPNPDQTTLIRKLSKLNHPVASRTLVRLLGEVDPYSTGSILKALNDKPRKHAYGPLVEILESGEYFQARRACSALGKLGDPRAIEPIKAFVLKDGPDSTDRAACARTLGEFGEEALDALHEILNSPDGNLRDAAVSSLKKISSIKSVPYLLLLRNDPSQAIRDNAASALGGLGTPAVEYLTPLLSEDDPELIRFAVRALGETGTHQCTDLILPFLSHSNDHLRRSAILALARIGNPATVDTMLELMVSPDVFSRILTTGHMWKFKDERVVDALLNTLDDPDSQVRAYAAYDLGKLKERSAVEHLIEMLEDPKWMPRRFAFHALALIGDERAIGPLIEKLRDKENREYARQALIMFGKKALKPLGKARYALDRKEDKEFRELLSDIRIDCRLYADRKELESKEQFQISAP